MPDAHWRFQLSFEVGAPDWSLLDTSSAATLPAVQWRMENLVRREEQRCSELVVADFEREVFRERTRAGAAAARAGARKGRRKSALTKAQVRLAQAATRNRNASVTDLAAEFGIKPVTVYRYVGLDGGLREHGRRAVLVGL